MTAEQPICAYFKNRKSAAAYSVYSTEAYDEYRRKLMLSGGGDFGKDSLVAGVPVTLTVTLQVKREGCAICLMLSFLFRQVVSYASKPVNFSVLVYREYFKENCYLWKITGRYLSDLQFCFASFAGKYTWNHWKWNWCISRWWIFTNNGERIWLKEIQKIYERKGMIEAMKYTKWITVLFCLLGLAACRQDRLVSVFGVANVAMTLGYKMNDEILREAMFCRWSVSLKSLGGGW